MSEQEEGRRRRKLTNFRKFIAPSFPFPFPLDLWRTLPAKVHSFAQRKQRKEAQWKPSCESHHGSDDCGCGLCSFHCGPSSGFTRHTRYLSLLLGLNTKLTARMDLPKWKRKELSKWMGKCRNVQWKPKISHWGTRACSIDTSHDVVNVIAMSWCEWTEGSRSFAGWLVCCCQGELGLTCQKSSPERFKRKSFIQEREPVCGCTFFELTACQSHPEMENEKEAKWLHAKEGCVVVVSWR